MKHTTSSYYFLYLHNTPIFPPAVSTWPQCQLIMYAGVVLLLVMSHHHSHQTYYLFFVLLICFIHNSFFGKQSCKYKLYNKKLKLCLRQCHTKCCACSFCSWSREWVVGKPHGWCIDRHDRESYKYVRTKKLSFSLPTYRYPVDKRSKSIYKAFSYNSMVISKRIRESCDSKNGITLIYRV